MPNTWRKTQDSSLYSIIHNGKILCQTPHIAQHNSNTTVTVETRTSYTLLGNHGNKKPVYAL